MKEYLQSLCQQGCAHSCVSVCVCVLSCADLNDVNCICGLFWTLGQLGFFFLFLFRCSAIESTIICDLSSCHLYDSFFFLFSSRCPLLLHPPSLLCPCFCSISLCPFLSFCLFLNPAPLALPPGYRGTAMFMKPFNVLCNYPGNTSHHYSCQ